jgi:hypothetical protein
MKKLSLTIVAIVCISFVACKKDRVCTCTESGVSDKTTLIKVTKRQAKANCVSTSYENGNGTISKSDCVLSK